MGISVEQRLGAYEVLSLLGRGGAPVSLFRPGFFVSEIGQQYDVTADGQRFLIRAPISAQATTPITVVVNWPAPLKQ